MIPQIEIIKANKKRTRGGHVLVTDDEAQIVFSAEDGQVQEFVPAAVNPLFWSSMLKSPWHQFGDRLNSARSMEWRLYVTDTRIVLWSPDIETIAATVKTVENTAGHIYYGDLSSMSYGRSVFDTALRKDDAKANRKITTAATSSGSMIFCAIQIDEYSEVTQVAVEIEADPGILVEITQAVSARLGAMSGVRAGVSERLAGLTEADFDSGGGRIVVNPDLDEHGLMEIWFESNLSVTFEEDEELTEEHAIAEGVDCRHCDERIDVDSEFCPMCGRQDPFGDDAAGDSNVFCTNCGAPMGAGVRFCGKCGARADGGDASAMSGSVPAQTPVPARARRAEPKKVSKLVIERRKRGGAWGIVDASSLYNWDVFVDGVRVDSLYREGNRVTIERDHAFVCFLRCENDIHEQSSEMRIPVAEGQTKRNAFVYKKAIFGFTFQEVPW
jgi:hypothetical protein